MDEAHPEELSQEIERALDSSDRAHTVALLQAVQERLGYLPLEAITAIAERLEISAASVYGVATFYNQFRFTPPGKRHVRVCMGTACHIKGGRAILAEWERKLGIHDGEVTEDRAYSLEQVACVGCCVLAPVTVIGESVQGHLSPASIDDLMLRHGLEDRKAEEEGR